MTNQKRIIGICITLLLLIPAVSALERIKLTMEQTETGFVLKDIIVFEDNGFYPSYEFYGELEETSEYTVKLGNQLKDYFESPLYSDFNLFSFYDTPFYILSDISSVRVFKGDEVIYNQAISFCNKNGVCEPCRTDNCAVAENSLTCSDCIGGSMDGYCDMKEDNICDQDCGDYYPVCEVYDPDCAACMDYKEKKLIFHLESDEDHFTLSSIEVIEDNPYYFDYFEGEGFGEYTPYSLAVIDSEGKLIYDGSVNSYYLVEVPFSDRMKRADFSRDGMRIMTRDLNFCNNNGRCEYCDSPGCTNAENTLTCPNDCPKNAEDGFCSLKKDGICDPDCVQQYDCEDCIQDCLDEEIEEEPIYDFECPAEGSCDYYFDNYIEELKQEGVDTSDLEVEFYEEYNVPEEEQGINVMPALSIILVIAILVGLYIIHLKRKREMVQQR